MSRKSPFHREGNGAIDGSDLELNNDPLKVKVPIPKNFCHEDLSDTKHLE